MNARRFITNTAATLVALAAPAAAQFELGKDSGLGMDDAEITKDGKWAVVRENLLATAFRFYDLTDGSMVQAPTCPTGFSGKCQDAIALSDTRAVLLGSCAMIVDLTVLPSLSVLATHDTGPFPRDVVITPDGTIAAVRGGDGLYLFDTASGALLSSAPGNPTSPNAFVASFDVDSVVASDQHAVFVSQVGPDSAATTRVTVFDLKPAGGGAPVVVLETSAGGAATDQMGMPHDVALAPNGQFAAVRSELGVGFYRLGGATPVQLWNKRLFGSPGPFGGSAMDSIEVTNERILTISRWSNGGIGAQVDLFDPAGNQFFDQIAGDPHDLTIVPGGTRALVRTSEELFLYDVETLPAGNQLSSLDSLPTPTSHTSFGAGLDSVLATAERAVTLSRNGPTTDVRIFGLAGDTLNERALYSMPDLPTDLELSPNGNLAAVSGTDHALVLDLRTDALLFDQSTTFGSNQFPWCDGVTMNDEHAVAFGYAGPQAGWVTLIDLFQQPTSYCTSSPNSTGAGASIHATGSASILKSDLVLWGTDLPAGAISSFSIGAQQIAQPFGDGTLCVGGTSTRLPVVLANGDGVSQQGIDYATLSIVVTAGSIWNAQVAYRDLGGPGGTGFNLSNAVSIAFVP